MGGQSSEISTITITPEGVVDVKGAMLAPVSTSDIQNFNRTLANYSGSKNTLINASAELLVLCGTIARMNPSEELNTTRLELSRAIIDLKYKIVRLEYPPSVAENLCLLFAITLDEFILVSAWGAESGWENRTLVADLFGFRDGGDRFYGIADRALMQPRALCELVEIIYVLLKLGFRGKFNRSTEHERDRLIDRLEAALNMFAQKSKPKPIGRKIKDTSPPIHIISARFKLVAAAVVILGITVINLGLHQQTKSSLSAHFYEKREIAEGTSTTTFVFSSKTGAVTVEQQE